MKKLIKRILILTFFAGVLGAGYYFLVLPRLNQDKKSEVIADKLFGWRFPVAKFPLTGDNQKLIAYSSIRDPGGVAQGLPVRLKVPAIGVDSAIEDALITNDGRMDVPIGSVNVAWFSLGPHPGRIGSAVIGGHFGITNGKPFVFYNLDKVKIGDKVYIVNDKDETLAFVVRSIKSFDRNADATTVFTSQDGLAHLNLITCEGIWNQKNGTYPLRLVVFTDAIPSEGSVTIPKATPAARKPNLPSTAIVSPTPSPTATPVTPEPVASPITLDETTPTPNVIQNSTLYVRSLFGNYVDAAITSLLILSIIFITTKIFWR